MRAILTLLAILTLAACSIGTAADDNDRFPTSSSYPAGTMERFDFTAGVPEGWRISALRTPPRPDATWKVVIITGTPSWSEYWAPTLAGLPHTREMIVADRPGFRSSEPEDAVRDLAKQADALAPMLEGREGQRILLVGQSFGAPVATLMAARYPDRVDALVLVSAYFGDRGPTARRMVAWARKYGIQSTIHTGGPSIPGSGLIDADVVLDADTDVVGHINGGHTALPDKQIRCICEGCKRGLEIVHNGNERAAIYTLRLAREMKELHRVILGTDAPAGSGVQPLGIARMVSMLSALGELPAEQAICLATGNTARMRKLDCGLIEVGRAADFVFMDKAQHSAGDNLLHSIELGDLPGIGMVVIDGLVKCQRSRNTPPATRIPIIIKG